MRQLRHLIAFHIGPVQDFIATARRSQDLWFGSWLLSELAKAVALEVVRQNGNDVSCLVFPAATEAQLNSPDFNAPNKVLAMVSGDPGQTAARAKEAMLRRLAGLCDDAFGRFKGPFDREVAWRQVKDSFEFFWASFPLEGGYTRARGFVESILTARKITRDFAPVSWGSTGHKCSLDGIRESVISKEDVDRMAVNRLAETFGLRRGEHLCGVCLLKRFGRRGADTRFLSTSHLAALPLLSTLRQEHRALVASYIGELKELGMDPEVLKTVRPPHPVFGSYDGEILFEERLREFFADEAKFARAGAALGNFLKEAVGSRRPLPYYAVLRADGDYMGETVDSQDTPEKHRELSRTQSEFAREARQIVESSQGCLIYSGGDDVLALLPLHTALVCARKLSETFQRRLAGFRIATEDHSRSPSSPTLSVGVVVAHHLDPLSDVLKSSEETLKAAKSVTGKAGLAVTLSKRSGEDRTVEGKSGKLDVNLERLVSLHWQDAIPDGAAYELRELANQLNTTDEVLRTKLEKVAFLEAKRILSRKRARRGTEPLSQEALRALEDWFAAGGSCIDALFQLSDSLVIARILADAADLAGGPGDSGDEGGVENGGLDHRTP